MLFNNIKMRVLGTRNIKRTLNINYPKKRLQVILLKKKKNLNCKKVGGRNWGRDIKVE